MVLVQGGNEGKLDHMGGFLAIQSHMFIFCPMKAVNG
jgi:hypothetical protein